MENQFITTFSSIVEFQMKFSGLELTVAGKAGDTFNASLFSSSNIGMNLPIDVIDIDGHFYFDCGYHATAQFQFVISVTGQICTYDNQAHSVNIIFSSFEKFIEHYALIDHLKRGGKYEHPYFFDLLDKAGFDELAQDFRKQDSACDKYNEWFMNDTLAICKSTWYDKGGFLFIFMAIVKSIAKTSSGQ